VEKELLDGAAVAGNDSQVEDAVDDWAFKDGGEVDDGSGVEVGAALEDCAAVPPDIEN
jgi:hypothetical protein